MNTASAIVIIAAVLLIVVGPMVSHEDNWKHSDLNRDR